jgi:hypothetical protein
MSYLHRRMQAGTVQTQPDDLDQRRRAEYDALVKELSASLDLLTTEELLEAIRKLRTARRWAEARADAYDPEGATRRKAQRRKRDQKLKRAELSIWLDTALWRSS